MKKEKMENEEQFRLRKIGNYTLSKTTLGKGNFGRVELAEHCLTKVKVAMKIVDMGSITEDYVKKNFLRETSILKNIHHENIIRLYETLSTKDIYCLVTEYLPGGSLQEYISQQKQKKLTEKHARAFFRQLLSAMNYLHGKGILHRDLKLQNLMLDASKKKLKIIDFGLSSFLNKNQMLNTHCGSAAYAAPELLEKGTSYGTSVEVWSLGVILFAMVTGKLPFNFTRGDKVENVIAQIRRGLCLSHEKYVKPLSKELRNLLEAMLEPDLTRRINLASILTHSWVTDGGKAPMLPVAPEMVPQEIRQKIIEKVAQIYSTPLGSTIDHLRYHKFDSVDASYNILLDQTIELNKSNRRSNSRATAVPLDDKKTYSGKRPQSARPDRRSSSTMRNYSNEKFATLDPKDSSPNDVERNIPSDSNDGCGGALFSSCLQVKRKETCSPEKRDKAAATPPTKSAQEFTPMRVVCVRKTDDKSSSNGSVIKKKVKSDRKIPPGTPVRVHAQTKSSRPKSSFKRPKSRPPSPQRPLSPFEARQMIHRDSYPVKQKSVEAATITLEDTQQRPKSKWSFGGCRVLRSKPGGCGAGSVVVKKSKSPASEKVVKLVSSPEYLKKSTPSKRVPSRPTSSHSKLRIEDANEILKYESRVHTESVSRLSDIQLQMKGSSTQSLKLHSSSILKKPGDENAKKKHHVRFI